MTDFYDQSRVGMVVWTPPGSASIPPRPSSRPTVPSFPHHSLILQGKYGGMKMIIWINMLHSPDPSFGRKDLHEVLFLGIQLNQNGNRGKLFLMLNEDLVCLR